MQNSTASTILDSGSTERPFGNLASLGCHGKLPLKPEQIVFPPLNMDDFNILGFGGGTYVTTSGNEWMESLSGDLKPCESTESSTLPPVMVDSWENDFTLPRDLRVRVSIKGAAMVELQQEEYALQQQQEQQEQLGSQVVPAEDINNPSGKDVVSEAEGRSTESDYSGDKDQSVHLVHLLLECATQLEKSHESTLPTLRRLRDLSSPFGDPMQRVAAYFCDALTKRVAGQVAGQVTGPPSTVEAPYNSFVACQVLNEACPFMIFAHLTANQAILESVKGCQSVHIIDFGITHGIQWAALLQAFASQSKKLPPPKVKITGIGVASESVLVTGRRLQSFAEHLGVEFEFCPVVMHAMTDFTPESVTLTPDENLVANFMLQLHELLGDDGSPSVQRMLKSVAALAPNLVTLTEYDAALNGSEFKPKFIDALHFYCALFDALDATMARDCQDRLSVESTYFARQIENIVACEGAERTQRHESCEQWSRHMRDGGFVSVPLSHYAHSQAQQLLWQYCDNFRLQRPPGGCISLTWQDRSLITVSVWKLSDPTTVL